MLAIAAVAMRPGVVQRVEVDQRPIFRDVHRVDDAGKPGTTRSVLQYALLRQDPRTTGVSPDTLRFRFDAPAVVLGVGVSVDIWGPKLTEVVVGINQVVPYGTEARDWLIHTSDATDGPSKIDERAWFGEDGFVVEAGDYVGVGAWLLNDTDRMQGITPEVIVYYRWL
jgi:hypothetical protein